MIGIMPIPEAKVTEYFGYFLQRFPDEEARLNSARALANQQELHTDFLTRAALSARWKDDPERELRPDARRIYNLKNTLDHNVGQTVLKLHGFKASDLNTGGPGLPKSGGLIEIDILASEYLHYDFFGIQPHENGLPFTTLDIPISVEIAGTDRQKAYILGNGGVVFGPNREPAGLTQAYESKVAIDTTEAVYRNTRQVRFANLVFGNHMSFKVMRRLLQVAGGPVHEQFEELIDAGGVSPELPLPPLMAA